MRARYGALVLVAVVGGLVPALAQASEDTPDTNNDICLISNCPP